MTQRDYRKAVETYVSYPCEWEDPRVSEARGCADPKEALAMALASAGPEDLVLVTGSLYLIGDVLPTVQAKQAKRGRE